MNHIEIYFERLPESELQRRVRQYLAVANLPALRQIRVDAEQDTVELRGLVRTFYEKQMATEFARRVAGVINVRNLVEVQTSPPVGREPRLQDDAIPNLIDAEETIFRFVT